MGLVDRVVADGTALAAAVELAEEIAAFPWPCVVNDRRSVYEGLGLGLDDALANEDRLGRETIFADGFADGVARFTAGGRRPPGRASASERGTSRRCRACDRAARAHHLHRLRRRVRPPDPTRRARLGAR